MKKLYEIFCSAVIIFCGSVFFTGCNAEVKPRREVVLGTVCSVNAYRDGTKKLYDQLFQKLYQIENLFSLTKNESELSRVNENAGKEKTEVSEETYFLIEKSLWYADESNGAFNPAIGPVVKLWGINTEHPAVPSEKEIQEALEKTDWHKVKLSSENGKYFVFLEEENMSLELGGIAKGYAADCLVKMLQENNVSKAVIDLGGNIVVFGNKEDGSDWKVGVKNPADVNSVAAVLSLKGNTSVVTSGVYERFFIEDGTRYHHIIDSKTGWPSDGGINSRYDGKTAGVTVVSSSSTDADALSTTAFILGPDRFQEFLESTGLKESVSAIFISEDLQYYEAGDLNFEMLLH